MEYVIRSCRKEDLKTLVVLCAKHAAYEQTDYQPEGKEAFLEKAIFSATPKLYCLVVEDDKQVVGYCSYTFDFSTWDAADFLYLDCLYLEPDYRSKGIGEVMIRKLQAIASQNHCVNIQWQTPVFNERAIQFYRRIGGEAKEKMRFSLKINYMMIQTSKP
jgi:ribosomal protein S18 acetylase RimI-like enzyme